MDNNIIISSQENILLMSLKNFYNMNKDSRIIIDIINGTSKISIRLINFLITNYSKKNNLIYKINNNSFNIYSNYKSQLKSYNKKYFDPFSRGNRIPFFFKFDDDEDCIITTIGQLNFFKWYLNKQLNKYILNNFNKLENKLMLFKKENSTKVKKKNKKKNTIEKTPIIINNKEKKINKIVVSFD
jgi:hypothetical protein